MVTGGGGRYEARQDQQIDCKCWRKGGFPRQRHHPENFQGREGAALPVFCTFHITFHFLRSSASLLVCVDLFDLDKWSLDKFVMMTSIHYVCLFARRTSGTATRSKPQHRTTGTRGQGLFDQ
jgi:hypothetical protein